MQLLKDMTFDHFQPKYKDHFFKAKPKLKDYSEQQALLKQNKVFWEIENDHI